MFSAGGVHDNEFNVGSTVDLVPEPMMSRHFEGVELLTADEVAAVLRVSKMTVYRKIHSGELPSVHFGRSYRVPAAALEAYFPEHKQVPAPPEDSADGPS